MNILYYNVMYDVCHQEYDSLKMSENEGYIHKHPDTPPPNL